MKFIKYIFFLLAFIVVGAFTLQAQNILAKPNPARLLNDAANIFSLAEKNNLEHKLISVEKYSSNQISIVSLNSLDGYPIEDYAKKLFNVWGIGDKEKNNGILLLFSLNDRKIRIEVGYGIEGAISDIIAKSIIDNDITPNFKNREYYAGINKAIDDLVLAANGIYEIPIK
jgi:uncharacterized protein